MRDSRISKPMSWMSKSLQDSMGISVVYSSIILLKRAELLMSTSSGLDQQVNGAVHMKSSRRLLMR